MTRAWRSHWTHAALLALLTAIVHTWPLATNPAGLSLNYNGDVQLNEWIVTWVQRQLLRDPLHLFQGNIFYPARDVLAFSEPLIAPAILGYPLRLIGGSPVLVHNILLIGGLALTMVAGYALTYAWTSNRIASLLAATAWTFNTLSLVRLEHLQAAHAYGIPLAVLATDRLITTGRWRHAVWLAGWMVVMAYSSGYLVIFTAIALAVLLAARVSEWHSQARRIVPALVLAAVAAGVVILPLYLPYRRVAEQQGLVRPMEQVAEFSSTLSAYAQSKTRLHGLIREPVSTTEYPPAYFPGVVVTLLAGVAIAACVSRRVDGLARSRTWALVAIAATAVVLSLGTHTPVYGWLYAVFPPLASIRAVARFGVLWMLAVGVLAGLGLAVLVRGRSSRLGVSVGIVLIVAVNAEALRAPHTFERFRGIPRVYELLADLRDPVVLVEVPFYPPEAVFMNAEYVFNSTAHWRPLMNGYSGFTPPAYRGYAWVFWNFPDRGSIEAIRAAGATHIMVHPKRFEHEATAMMTKALAHPALERVAVGRENVTLFRIK